MLFGTVIAVTSSLFKSKAAPLFKGLAYEFLNEILNQLSMLSIYTLERDLQPLNASSPIDVTLFGISMLERDLQPLNA